MTHASDHDAAAPAGWDSNHNRKALALLTPAFGLIGRGRWMRPLVTTAGFGGAF